MCVHTCVCVCVCLCVCACVCVCVCVCVWLAVLTKTVITCKIEYSQALKLRSECNPKHHDRAQIALPSSKIALRLHSKTPRLRSDCTPKQQDCAQIALQNTTTALRLHSQATRLRSDCTLKIPKLHSDCTPDDQDRNPKNWNCAPSDRSERCCTPAESNLTAIRKAAVWPGAPSALRALGFRTVEKTLEA